MIRAIHGTVRGRTIELHEDPGLAEGQEVQVHVKPVAHADNVGGLQRCAGALSDEWTNDDDRILEQIRRDRKIDTRRSVSS